MRTVEIHCGRCAVPRAFEQPACRDGHGRDCDEWICTKCGEALLIASFTPVRWRRRKLALARRAA